MRYIFPFSPCIVLSLRQRWYPIYQSWILLNSRFVPNLLLSFYNNMHALLQFSMNEKYLLWFYWVIIYLLKEKLVRGILKRQFSDDQAVCALSWHCQQTSQFDADLKHCANFKSCAPVEASINRWSNCLICSTTCCSFYSLLMIVFCAMQWSLENVFSLQCR